MVRIGQRAVIYADFALKISSALSIENSEAGAILDQSIETLKEVITLESYLERPSVPAWAA